jgi:hypothetical protein
MKKIYINLFLAGIAILWALASCDTTAERTEVQQPYQYTESYYQNLRAYHATSNMKNRKIFFFWAGSMSTSYASPAFKFMGLPDSVDIVSEFGALLTPEEYPEPYADMQEMRAKKGIKYVQCYFAALNDFYSSLKMQDKYGLSWDDVMNDKTTLDPTGEYPDWCVIVGDTMINFVKNTNIDGVDLDNECDMLGMPDKMIKLVKYLNKYMGPKSPNPDKLVIIDHYYGWAPAGTEPYVDYLVCQAYNAGNFPTSDVYPLEKEVAAEQFGQHWADGGNICMNASYDPGNGHRVGGVGVFIGNGDYNNDIPYKWCRKAIQIQNPAINK